MAVTLGAVVLDGLAAVAGIRFGGAQALVVHKLPGGARVIDAMGPDDDDIAWRGFFTGDTAPDQARLLDAMRQSGAVLPLAWDAASYNVVISHLELTYNNSWWIGYRIRCKVVSSGQPSIATAAPAILPLITADLTVAAAFCNTASAAAAAQSPGALTAGTPANAAASAAIAASQAVVENAINTADAGMATTDLSDLVATAGTLAGLAASRAYLARAAVNLANARH
jgi:hypothetical protein